MSRVSTYHIYHLLLLNANACALIGTGRTERTRSNQIGARERGAEGRCKVSGRDTRECRFALAFVLKLGRLTLNVDP